MRSILFLKRNLYIFLILSFLSKREEPDLFNRFGENYEDYKSTTPMFIPNIVLLITDIFNISRRKK